MTMFYITAYLVNGKILTYTKFNKKDAFLVKKVLQDNTAVKEIKIENDRSQVWNFRVA